MRRTEWLATLFVLGLVAAACGDDDAGSELVEGPPPSTTTEANDASTPVSDAAPPSSDAAAEASAPGETYNGEATYYNANGTGACGQPTSNSALVGALNGAQYSKANCGRCASIKGPLGAVVVKLLDKCPGCSYGDIDLSSTAFQKIAKLADGRVKITWSFVACP